MKSRGLRFERLRLDWTHHVESKGKVGTLSGSGRVVDQRLSRVAMLNSPSHVRWLGRAAPFEERFSRVAMCLQHLYCYHSRIMAILFS